MRLAVIPQRNRLLASARRAARAIKSLAVAVLLLLPITAAWPQARGQLTLAQAFDTMKPGQWIRVDGTPQISPTGPTIQSYGLKLMTGDVRAAVRLLRIALNLAREISGGLLWLTNVIVFAPGSSGALRNVQ